MSILKSLVLGIRFCLEICTVAGIFYGGIIQPKASKKLFFIALSIIIVVIWFNFGAPKSPNVFVGLRKLLLELAVYGLGIASFYYLFGFKVGTFYTLVTVIDLVLIYALNLQGH